MTKFLYKWGIRAAPWGLRAVSTSMMEDPLRCAWWGNTGRFWRAELADWLGSRDCWNCQYSLNNLYISVGDRAEGAENKTSDKANNNRGLSNSSGGGKSQSSSSPEGQALESRMKRLSLQCAKGRDGILADLKVVQIGWSIQGPGPSAHRNLYLKLYGEHCANNHLIYAKS